MELKSSWRLLHLSSESCTKYILSPGCLADRGKKSHTCEVEVTLLDRLWFISIQSAECNKNLSSFINEFPFEYRLSSGEISVAL